MPETYTDTSAIVYNDFANNIASRLDKECNVHQKDWKDFPDLVDLWRVCKFAADVHEAYGKMIYGNIRMKNGMPDLIGECISMPNSSVTIFHEIMNLNITFNEITYKWKLEMNRLSDIVNHLIKVQQEKDEQIRKDRVARFAKMEEVELLKKQARLGF